MARFDIFVNPNRTARHLLYVDVQSDFVRLSTRWGIPLSRHVAPIPVVSGAQALIQVNHQEFVMDTPNLLAVPASLLHQWDRRGGRRAVSAST